MWFKKTRAPQHPITAQRIEQIQAFIDARQQQAIPVPPPPPSPTESSRLLELSLESFEKSYENAHPAMGTQPGASVPAAAPQARAWALQAPRSPQGLASVVANVDEGFSETLLQHISDRGLREPEVYKRAHIDRKLFSKIRKGQGYQPSKPTAIALGVALGLDLDGLRDLIGRAGYTLTHASKADLIVEYFVTQGIYDIFEINEALFAFGQPPLGR